MCNFFLATVSETCNDDDDCGFALGIRSLNAACANYCNADGEITLLVADGCFATGNFFCPATCHLDQTTWYYCDVGK